MSTGSFIEVTNRTNTARENDSAITNADRHRLAGSVGERAHVFPIHLRLLARSGLVAGGHPPSDAHTAPMSTAGLNYFRGKSDRLLESGGGLPIGNRSSRWARIDALRFATSVVSEILHAVTHCGTMGRRPSIGLRMKPMKNNKSTHISNAEVALLGLLSDRPKYAYQIKQDIREYGMTTWTALTLAIVHKLLRSLELNRWVEVRPEKVSGERLRNYYHITDKGQGVFRDAIRTRLVSPEVLLGGFDVAVYWSDTLPVAEAQELLARYRAELAKSQRFWEEMVPYLHKRKCPRADQALCARKAYMLAGELCWLDEFTEGMVGKVQWADGRTPAFGQWMVDGWQKMRRVTKQHA
jgi:DNA-binding PadR family transcriptional regulator